MLGLGEFQFPSLLQVIFITVMNKIMPVLFKKVKHVLKGPPGEPELQVKDWKKEVVYLVQFPRSPFIPNVSPFCIKVEAFLRANKITYEVRDTLSGRSKHHMLPFIELNGHQVADSQLIILHLKEHFKLEDYKTAKDDAFGRAISRTCEHHTFHAIQYFKVLQDPAEFSSLLMGFVDNPLVNSIKPLLKPIIGMVFAKKIRQRVGTALGLFPKEDMINLLNKDFQMFEDVLEGHKYLFGDKITEADVTVFAHLAVTVFIPIDSYPKRILIEGKKYPRLSAFVNNIRADIWGKDFERN